jgi:hypothetical protein
MREGSRWTYETEASYGAGYEVGAQGPFGIDFSSSLSGEGSFGRGSIEITSGVEEAGTDFVPEDTGPAVLP